ncbi:MAG: enoyl-CoA hydratase/isomerase family protein [Frankiales bacterium]|nr:enoyl-CoA hydratase/isomerase family protein [Frankiales bacterium]
MSTTPAAIRYDKGEDGVVVLVLDDPGKSANTMNPRYAAALDDVLARLEAERDTLTGVIVTSAKKTFFAGADLDSMGGPRTATEVFEGSRAAKRQLRRLETLGVPVVACLNGAALGGGLEIALACHHRIAAEVKGSVIGLPEVSLGLLPGAGGIVRTVRMLGLVEAFTKVLSTGQRFTPTGAKEVGLVDELVDSVEELVPAARAWLATSPSAVQPWDAEGYRVPGGTPTSGPLSTLVGIMPAGLRKQLKGAPMPAPAAILAAAVEGLQVDIETAFDIEGRYFVSLVTGQVSKNMTKAFFHDMQAVNGGKQRPAHEPTRVTKVAVLGAGMMGAGIAYSFAKVGVDVVLKDVSLEAAHKGKAYSKTLCEKAVSRGRITQDKADALLARITPAAAPEDVAGCDAVVEAVFESQELKHQVFQEVQAHLTPDALLCSNTSTLPITGLAEGVQRPEDFIGLHFFSPVDKMPLVEIIRGERTSDAALARAFDVVRLLGKTPIVVNDSRGFFTSRVIGTFIQEGLRLLAEGMHPASIEQASAQAGYPAPVLQLLDELSMTLTRKVREQTRAATGDATVTPADTVVDTMVVTHGRGGRAAGAGFYDYVDGKRTRLWPGLLEAFGGAPDRVPFVDAQERMLFAEALETARCFDEGVLTSDADANVGSILGIGFPAWTGGVAQYVEQYSGPAGVGVAGFVARADELAGAYGERFRPPASLRARAAASTSNAA